MDETDDFKQEDAQFDLDEFAKWAAEHPYNPPSDDEILAWS